MEKNENFPACEDWAAALPHLKQNFTSVADGKTPLKQAASAVDQEFRSFAALDLSNM